MATDDKLLLKVGVDDVEAQKRLTQLDKKLAALNTTARNLSIAGAASFGAITAALGGAVKKFSDFEAGFTDAVTLLDNGSFSAGTLEAGISGLKDGVIQLGIQSGQSFENLNKGLFDLISAGVPAESAISTLTTATQLAAAGATDVSVAVNAITNAMGAYGLKASEAESISQKLFTAQKYGKTTVEELANNMGKASSIAASTGVSFDELMASVSAATLAGISTESSFTSLKAALSNVQKPTADAVAEADRLGIKFNAAALETQGLQGFLSSIVNSAGFTEESFSKLFGSTEALGLALAVTGPQADKMREILGALGDKAGTAETFTAALATKQATAQIAADKLARSTEAVAIAMGEQLAPYAIQVADKLSEVAQKIASLDQGTKDTIVSVAKFGLVMSGTATAAGIAVKGYTTIRAGLKALGIAFDLLRTKSTAAYAAATLGLSIAVSVGAGILAEYMLREDEATANTERNTQEATEAEKAKYAALKKAGENFNAEQARIREARKSGEIKTQTDMQAQLEASRLAFLERVKGINAGATAQSVATKAGVDAAEIEATTAQDAKKEELRRASLEKERQDTEAALMYTQAIQQQHRESELAFDAEFAGLDAQQRGMFTAEEKQAQLDRIKTTEQLDREAAQREIDQHVAARNRYIEDERRFGTVYAELNQIMHSAGFEAAKEGTAGLAELVKSENAGLKDIGKTATKVQIGISTAESAMKAFSALAWIPYVGPALGTAAAAAITLYGGEKISKVDAMRTGGIVPNRAGSARDRVPAILEPGELVVPRAITEALPKEMIDRLLGKPQRMRDGGIAAGAKENKDLYQTFADLMPIPKIFVDLIKGKGIDLTPSGFGAEAMTGVLGGMLSALVEAAREIRKKIEEQLPGGVFTEYIRNIEGSAIESLSKSYASGLESANKTKDKVKKALGFRDGGIVMPAIGSMADRVPAMLEPGEAVLSRVTTAEVLRGERVIGGPAAAASGPQRVQVEFELKGELARIVRARQREQTALGI